MVARFSPLPVRQKSMQFLPPQKHMSGTRSHGRSQPLTAAHVLRSHGRSPSFVRNDFEAGKNAKTVNGTVWKNMPPQNAS